MSVVKCVLRNDDSSFLNKKLFFQTLAKGLQDLLDYDGDVEDVFMQTFRISYKDVFGCILYHNLKGDDENPVPVTNENRQVRFYLCIGNECCISEKFSFQKL